MKPLRGNPHPTGLHRWVVDIETSPLGVDESVPLFVLLAVAYDGKEWIVRWGEHALEELLEELIDEKAEDWEAWAHYGGAFDWRFCFEWLFETREATARMTNVGSLVLSTEGRVDGAQRKVRFKLLDSIRLLPAKLRDIGDWLGYPKGDIDFMEIVKLCETAEGRSKVLKYCKQDCKILWEALTQAETLIATQGVSMRSTLASTSSAGVRARLDDDTVAYTPEDIEEDTVEDANFGGRVEAFEEWCGRAWMYDFKSMYPAAMASGPLPWRHLLSAKKWKVGKPGVVHCVVMVPDSCFLPVLPYRSDEGRIFFPTGTWEASFIEEELRYAVEIGAARIERVIRHEVFTESTVLQDFALSGWERREKSKGFERELWKRYLNSCYGKLVERCDKYTVCVNPKSVKGWTSLSDRFEIYGREISYAPGFRNVVTGAAITARSRVKLHRDGFCVALKLGGKLYYCDTDSLVTTAELPTGDGLGDLGLQHVIAKARFAAPKLYWLWTDDPGDDRGRFIGRAKGLPRDGGALKPPKFEPEGIDMGEAQMNRLMDGESITFIRTSGIKERLAEGRVGFTQTKVTKIGKKPGNRGKRAEGGQRAWTIRELTA